MSASSRLRGAWRDARQREPRATIYAKITVIVGGTRQVFFWIGAFILPLLPLVAQQNQCSSRSIAVNVEATDGTPVTNLQAADFRASLAGDSIEVVGAAYEQGPRRVLILLDVSKSMTRSSGEWSATLNMLGEFVAGAPSNVSVGVMIFAGGAKLVTGFIRERSATVARLADLKTITELSLEGIEKTAIFDALGTGLSLFQPARLGDSILLVTDADENASMEKEPQLLKRFIETGVRVFGIIGFHRRSNSPLPRPLTSRELLLIPDVIQMTGGRAASFRWEVLGYFKAEQRTMLDKLIQDMSGSYNLELKLRQPISRFHRWKLSVSDGHPQRKRLNVLYPPKLAPCN